MYFNNTTVAPTAILFTLIHSVGMPLAFIEGQHQKQVFFLQLYVLGVRMLLRMLIVMFHGVPTFNLCVSDGFLLLSFS